MTRRPETAATAASPAKRIGSKFKISTLQHRHQNRRDRGVGQRQGKQSLHPKVMS